MENDLVNVLFKDRSGTYNIIMLVKLNGIASLYDLLYFQISVNKKTVCIILVK